MAMRLHPALSEETILEQLRNDAKARWGEIAPELEQTLKTLAHAMADISALELPESVEPQLL
jgi:hypothetical protein